MSKSILSTREKAPGDYRVFGESERDFVAGLELVLPSEYYAVERSPTDLKRIFQGEGKAYGVVPDASITALTSGRKLFFEVKRQGPQGNAEERAMRHHTSRFQTVLKEHLGYSYHPYFSVFCEDLATHPRYTTKFKFFIEPTHYLCWAHYDLDLLSEWINNLCERYL